MLTLKMDKMDFNLNKLDIFSMNQNNRVGKVKSLQHYCRTTVLSTITLDRVYKIRHLPLPNLLKDYLCSFSIPRDFDLDGFHIDYHCNFPNHVHHKVHQIHPGRCLIDGSKVLIKSQHLNTTCRTCDTAGKCTMDRDNERDIWLNLKHENLMRCLMTMSDPLAQRVCLVFEFPGITLQDFVFRMFLAKQPVPETISWQVLLKLSSVLIYLENNSIIPWELCHPQNVTITNQGEIKLENLLLYLPTLHGSKYRTNTAKYLSPEQTKGELATPQTLVWGLGCILYEISTKASQNQSSIKTQTCPTLSYDQAIHCNKELSKVMCECLRSNPCSRPSLADLQQKAEDRLDHLLLDRLDNEVGIKQLIASLDRLPFSGGFLR